MTLYQIIRNDVTINVINYQDISITCLIEKYNYILIRLKNNNK